MKAKQRVATWALAIGIAAGAGAAQAQYGPPPGPPPGGYQERPGEGWDAPPREFRDAERQGFLDGISGARKDFENRRRPNVNNRDEFRHPSVPGPLRRDYKNGFRRGYESGVRHFMEGGAGPR